MNTEFNFPEVVTHFQLIGKLKDIERYGEGHINDTFKLLTEEGGQEHLYILQRINNKLFTDVAALMNNILLVTEFNRAKVKARGGNPDREALTVIKTREGKPYYFDGVHYFRVYIFIDEATSYQTVEKPKDFYESAVAFGNFANLLAEFDASKLYEVLPNFHNTRIRYENFMNAVKADKMGRAGGVTAEIEFAQARQHITGAIVDKLASGEMPLKVTHNDTKLNNVMLDDKTGEAVAVIDLDTIMPGSLCYDFGDSIRFGCNPAAEDEPDLSKVNFRIDLFAEYAKGYLSAVGETITRCELDHLAMGAILMTYECGIRFLTDYLEGDTYFRTHRAGQNLDRTRTQFKLVADMEKVLPEMNAIVERAYVASQN